MTDEVLDYAGVVKLHVEKFGVEPVITGVNYWRSEEIIKNILEAFENNQPYVEDEVEEGTVI